MWIINGSETLELITGNCIIAETIKLPEFLNKEFNLIHTHLFTLHWFFCAAQKFSISKVTCLWDSDKNNLRHLESLYAIRIIPQKLF
jgi:hypothetical protein